MIKMIILGYAAILGYVFALIYLLGPPVQKRTNTETSRKMVHTGLFLVWVLIDLFFKDTVHQIIVPVIFIILNALSYKFNLYKSVEREGEEENHKGTIYFAVAITVIMTIAYFRPEYYYCSGIASFCLTFGDGFAAMIGYNTETKKLRNGKSMSGFIACIASSAAALLIFRAVYPVDISAFAVLLIAVYAGVLELVGAGLDNFSVTFGVFFLSRMMTELSETLFVVPLLIFFIVFFTGSIDYYGSMLSMLIVFLFAYAEENGLWFLLASYFTIFFVAVIRKLVRSDLKKEKGRSFKQILINGGLGALCMGLYSFVFDRKLPELYLVGIISIGGNFIDSLSSDVGILSRSMPFDPIKRRRVPSGLSGGMSLLGTGTALAASILIGLFTGFAPLYLSTGKQLLVMALVFLQTLLDTVLGSCVQVRYRCTVCGELTEKKEHCGATSEYYSGVKLIDNNAVNAISSLIITALAALIFLVTVK